MAIQLLIRVYILGYIQGCPQLPPPLTLSNATPQITLSAQNLTRSFGNQRVIHDLTLQLKRGEVLGLLGPNGAGKSTTLQMLTGCLLPGSGKIEICGINLRKNPMLAKAQIGYLPEAPPLYRELNVDDYLIFAARLRGIKDVTEPLKLVKQRCGLESVSKKIISMLSKGYQQRVGIAQAIIHRPAVIVLDEPTVGLDPSQIRDIRKLIRELGDTSSVILSTHLLNEVESVCDRVQIMQHGKLIYSDSSLRMQDYGKVSGFLISLRNPPALSELESIDGVTSVEQMTQTQFRILHAPEEHTGSLLLSLAAQNGWQLEQLSPLHATLEDVFVKITGENS
ncbi:MAG: ABC transporter ATP-binding protein [Proteobacteria bacterium]|nr:ABC transporter ATP-binding protein [Pseudomonadota bacterium]